ncbi:MAG: rod-binding protein [Pseudomonadota bacterium]
MNDPMLNAAALSAQKVGGAQAADKPVPAKVRAAAEEFEAVFLSQMLATMTQELGGAGGVAGGDDVYRDMFTKEVAKMISRTGGIGVADTILQEMLKNQEIG